ncbi:ATP-dependent DNA ligase [Paenibacillus sp. NPDC058071]|uniref:ATP-dependent DNA ligase n=1 Tax=Paenibacillus sp. NPDC058071 TaxID=3346326 RepID=UPI0036DBA091
MWMEPMLTSEVEEPFSDDDYLFEPMLDGHRLLLSFIGQRTRLFTRYRNDISEQYPELLNVPMLRNADIIVDGEVAFVDSDTGETRFETLMERFRMKKRPRIREAAKRLPVTYFVFDLLYYNGQDLRDWPLSERKRLLSELLGHNTHFRILPHIRGDGKRMFEMVKRLQLDGMACKPAESRYIGGRDGEWLKVINHRRQELQVAGWRKDRRGWLIRTNESNTSFVDGQVAPELAAWLKDNGTIAREDRDNYYLKAGVLASVAHRGWLSDGRMRKPALLRLYSEHEKRMIAALSKS